MTTKKGVLIFALLFIAFYVLIYVVPTVSDIFQQTYIAEYGTLDVSYETDCIFVRGESLYKAPSAGSVDRKVNAGDLMRPGSLIATVGGKEMYNNESGIVSYYYDGFEDKITPDKLADIKKSFFDEFKEGPGVQDAVSDKAESSNVIFKIVDRSKWYLVCWLDSKDAERFTEGSRITVDFKDGNSVKMSVYSASKDEKQTKIVLSCDRYYESFDRYRVKECSVIYSSNSGIIVNTDSICKKDGQTGVYVIDKFGKANFTPVLVYATNGNKSVVARNYFYDSEGYPVETVKNYIEILKKPKQ